MIDKGSLIVISGPSGSGKGTILNEYNMKYKDDKTIYSISATTRLPREGEEDGVNYYFVDHEKFRSMIDRQELLEYAEYVGNYYGTPEAPLNQALADGNDIILDIEVQGALNVRKRRPDATLIYMMAPSFEELKRRLYGRGDTAPEVVEERLNRAKWEFSQAPQYDYLVINDRIENAVNEIISIITAQKCKMDCRIHVLKEEL